MHRFGAAGLVNGLAVLADEETRTYWDHITGEAFKGPLTGHRLSTWPILMTNASAAMADDPALMLSLSTFRSPRAWLMKQLHRKKITSRGMLPWVFRLTMNRRMDPRLDRLTQGLGVIEAGKARFYPMAEIAKGKSVQDVWQGRVLTVERGAFDGSLRATWPDGSHPMQLLTRWYGFSFTFPGCDIYSKA